MLCHLKQTQKAQKCSGKRRKTTEYGLCIRFHAGIVNIDSSGMPFFARLRKNNFTPDTGSGSWCELRYINMPYKTTMPWLSKYIFISDGRASSEIIILISSKRA